MLKTLAFVALAACSPSQLSPPALDAGDDATTDAAVDADTRTPACAADPAQCLYAPAPLPVQVFQFTFTDTTRIGGPRDIPVAVRVAPSAPTPAPIVVWSHGGATGQTDPLTALDKWAVAAAEIGYVSIAIAHEPRDAASIQTLCTSLGMDAAACATFKYLDYDRPLDIQVVFAALEELAAMPPWTTRLDLTKLAVGGHSAGAGAVLMLDGAPREINGAPIAMVDTRPIAFLALSPQAPGSEGFTADAYAKVVRPTFVGTGRGDDNPPDTADGRASVYDLFQPGDKARIFVEDATAIHTVFELETDACAAAATLAHCEEMRDWVKSAGLAFLDAHLRAAPDAIAWIASTNLAAASAGVAQWSTR